MRKVVKKPAAWERTVKETYQKKGLIGVIELAENGDAVALSLLMGYAHAAVQNQKDDPDPLFEWLVRVLFRAFDDHSDVLYGQHRPGRRRGGGLSADSRTAEKVAELIMAGETKEVACDDVAVKLQEEWGDTKGLSSSAVRDTFDFFYSIE